jgi:hypothetical protein
LVLRDGSVRDRALTQAPEAQQHGQRPFELSVEMDSVRSTIDHPAVDERNPSALLW